MKRLTILLLVFATICGVKADDRLLKVWQTNGEVLSISLNDEPRTTYADGKLVINTKQSTITIPLKEVLRYTYTGIPTGINKPGGTIEASFSKDGETLTFMGLKPQTKIVLYNTSGQMLRHLVADGRNKIQISVSDLVPGIYVVKANGVTYKITKP